MLYHAYTYERFNEDDEPIIVAYYQGDSVGLLAFIQQHTAAKAAGGHNFVVYEIGPIAQG